MTGFPRPAFDYSELFYNGFKFPPALSSTISSEPVYDDSERQVLYVKHSINIEFIIHDGVDDQYRGIGYVPIFPANEFATRQGVLSDASLKVFRQLLTTPGGHLVVNNTGFGGLRTNALRGQITDVKFGPKPRLLSWENIAGGRAIKVKWQCDVHIVEEACAEYTSASLMGHTATQSWEVSESGMTTRRTTGYIIIRANRLKTPTRVTATTNQLTAESQDTGTNVLTNPRLMQARYTQSADELRHLVNYPPLEGFKRTQDFRLSSDKTRLDYSLVDTEIESQNAYYPGTVGIEAKQKTSTKNLFAGLEWISTITATIKLPKDKPMTLAWIAFSKLAAKRRRLMRENAAVPSTDTKGKWSTDARPSGEKPLIMATHFSFEENLFKPEMRFSITWQMMCWRSFIFKAAGVGKAAYGNKKKKETWRKWQQELLGNGILGVQGVRGLRGLVYDKRSDLLFGLCDNLPSPNDSRQRTDTIPPPDNETGEDDLLEYENGEITEQNSWPTFKTTVELIEDTQRIPHYKLEPNEWPQSNNLYPLNHNSPRDDGTQSGYTYSKSKGSNTPPIIQARNSTKHLIRVTGIAERIKYDIAQPVAVYYGGKACYPVGQFRMKKTERYDPISGERIVKAMWHQVYQLSAKPIREWSAIQNTSTWG